MRSVLVGVTRGSHTARSTRASSTRARTRSAVRRSVISIWRACWCDRGRGCRTRELRLSSLWDGRAAQVSVSWMKFDAAGESAAQPPDWNLEQDFAGGADEDVVGEQL